VMTLGTHRPDTKVEVILGVDTHLDFHTAVAVDHLGRRLGELSVPTTPQRITRGFCAGRKALAP
jgi:transposase